MHQSKIRAGMIAGLVAGARYGLRADGKYNPDQGLFFDPMKLLVDRLCQAAGSGICTIAMPAAGLQRGR
ncbi:MAG: hypothetical protein MO846_04610 [Candidatus Devosia symbiotica]|nr:hypothetical protein [Candidatus Devosia symbiotica]